MNHLKIDFTLKNIYNCYGHYLIYFELMINFNLTTKRLIVIS